MSISNKQNLFETFRNVSIKNTNGEVIPLCISKLISLEEDNIHMKISNDQAHKNQSKLKINNDQKIQIKKSSFIQKFLSKDQFHQLNNISQTFQKSNSSIEIFTKFKKCLSYTDLQTSIATINQKDLFSLVHNYLEKIISDQKYRQKIFKQMNFITTNDKLKSLLPYNGKLMEQIDFSQSLQLSKGLNCSKTISIEFLMNNDSDLKNTSDRLSQNNSGNQNKQLILTEIQQLAQSQNIIQSVESSQQKEEYQLQNQKRLKNKNYNFKNTSLILLQKQCSFFQQKKIFKKQSQVSLVLGSEIGSSSLFESSCQNSSKTFEQVLSKFKSQNFNLQFVSEIFDNGDEEPQALLINLSICILMKYLNNVRSHITINNRNINLFLSLSTLIAYKIYYDLPVAGVLQYLSSLINLSEFQVKICERKFLETLNYELTITKEQYYKILCHLFAKV